MSNLPDYLKQAWPLTRQFERRILEAPVVLVARNGHKYRGWCTDISEGGLGATVACPLAVREEVALEFLLPNADQPICTRAMVRFADSFRYGFEFLTVTPDQRELIRGFLPSGKPRRA